MCSLVKKLTEKGSLAALLLRGLYRLTLAVKVGRPILILN